jgi:phthalate 4,5-cis-dihydrodiol dehydrogenase
MFKIGLIGFGFAARMLMPAIKAHGGFAVAAIADPGFEPAALQQETGVPCFANAVDMLAATEMDAVYVASPTHMHCEHVLAAIEAGRSVLVEKPMAASVQEALLMAEAAERKGVQLVVGHSHSFNAPIAAMHALIRTGELGAVRMINTSCHTNWMRRPRRPEELDSRLGGGVTFRQGAHQVDIARLLAGGLATRVQARTFAWDAERPAAVGAHSMFIEFANGAVATAVYNGYGGYDSVDACGGIDESGYPKSDAPAPVAASKAQRARSVPTGRAPYHPTFGFLLVSCEQGDLRQTPSGVMVCRPSGSREVLVPVEEVPRLRVVSELHDALLDHKTPLHGARWGVANVEVCAAAMESSVKHEPVELFHQIGVPA